MFENITCKNENKVKTSIKKTDEEKQKRKQETEILDKLKESYKI